MKLSKIINSTLIAATALIGLSACNDIDENDRFIEMPPIVIENTPRYVLLEEYTGQYCINCPEAHEAIHSLKEQYGDRFIAVSLHGGGNIFSIGEGEIPGLVGMRTPESEQYYQKAGGGALPCGQLGRTSGLLGREAWAAAVREEMKKESPVGIQMSPSITDEGKLHISLDIYSTEAVSGKLQLWVVESGIKALQLQPNGSVVMDYTHNHVFRATANGFDGQDINLAANTPTHTTATIGIKDTWTPANLSVVAFIYNGTGVVQALEVAVGSTGFNKGSYFDDNKDSDEAPAQE